MHFIAIGGSAMHNLAIVMSNKGYRVSGSDDMLFDPSKSRLEKAKIQIFLGWNPKKITRDIDVVLLGMHAKKDNPELLKAQNLGIPIYSYPEFLYQFSKNKTRIVITGSHGKTTITAMILYVLKYYNKEIDFMLGAPLQGFETTVHLTDENKCILIEGDEYLSSPLDLRPKIHWYRPDVALISGIAWDHINVFPTQEKYEKQFEIFIETITDKGTLIFNEKDEILKKMVDKNQNDITKIGYTIPDYCIKNSTTFIATSSRDFALSIFGEHNLLNVSGAQKVCQLMGISKVDFYKSIGSFKGALGRLELLKKGKNSFLFKDFAHAPSKVNATLKAVAQQFKKHKIIACLELHTYSSLDKNFISNYKNTLATADEAVVFYNPKIMTLKNRPPISTSEIKNAFNRNELLIFTEKKALHNYLFSQNYTQKVLLMMSSGSFGNLDWERLKGKVV